MRNRLWRRAICLLLIIITTTAASAHMLSVTSLAAEGVVGEVSWSFEESTGELRIEGEGSMVYSSGISYVPWSSYKDYITSVVIEEGVTEISDRAFELLYMVREIRLPETVRSIGDYAFSNCGGLDLVYIPARVTKIGESVFSECESLTKIEFGGTSKQWEAIDFGAYTDTQLKRVTVVFSPCGGNHEWKKLTEKEDSILYTCSLCGATKEEPVSSLPNTGNTGDVGNTGNIGNAGNTGNVGGNISNGNTEGSEDFAADREEAPRTQSAAAAMMGSTDKTLGDVIGGMDRIEDKELEGSRTVSVIVWITIGVAAAAGAFGILLAAKEKKRSK